MSRRVVQKYSMRIFAMLAQSLAMISDDHNNRVLIPSMRLQISNKIPQRRVRISDFTIVQTVFVYLRVGKRRLVRIMRIIKMYPNKSWPRGVRRQPLLRASNYIHATAFHSSPARLRFRVLGKVIVKTKSTIEPRRKRVAVKNDRRDKCSRVVSLCLN